MDDISKVVKYSNLLNIYDELLSATQKEIASDYYLYNLSLSEISENRGISRSAAEDAIKKATLKLDEFESKLHIYEKHANSQKIIAKLKQKLNSEDLKLLEELERIL